MAFWKKKDNLIITAAVAVFFIGLAMWPSFFSLHALRRPTAVPFTSQVSFSDPTGNLITLENFQGKPRIIYFWATWCPVCIQKMATLDAFAKEFKTQGGEVISISEDSSLEDAKAHLQHSGYNNLAAHLDTGGQLMSAFGVTGLPTAVFLDANGLEVDRIVGGVDWSHPAVRDKVSKNFP